MTTPDMAILEVEQNEGYGSWVLPCARDHEVAALVAQLRAMAPADRPIDRRHAPMLQAFAERMASLARDRSSPDDLRAGLDAAALADGVADGRDLTAVLPLLWRTAETGGLDPAAELGAAADRVGGPGAEGGALRAFAARPPEARSITVMGYEEVTDEFGFHYQRSW